MEAALVNLVEPGDEVLVGINGVFGTRMAEVASRAGAVVHRLERPWGEVFTADDLREALREHPDTKIVGIVHAETSTGARQPLEEIGALVREAGCLLVVDAVTSLGGIELRVDEWNVDACYSGTQKCLSCPPGLAPLTLNERAMQKVRSRTSPVRSWYLDLTLIDSYWTEGKRAYHHTAPISMNYALHEALALVLEEGLEATFARHALNSRALVAGLEAIGLSLLIPDPSGRLPMLNSVRVPEGVDEARVRSRLLRENDLEIGAGLGPLAGQIWRVGLMGESSRRENVNFFLEALERILREEGLEIEPGRAAAAASKVYEEAS